MKGARIFVFAVAIAAGGVAAFIAGRGPKLPHAEAPKVPKVETADILVAKSDIGVGETVKPGELQWQAWPKTASIGNFIRRNDNPHAIEKFSGEIARLPIVAGEPIREAKLVNAKGSGFMAAILPSGMRAVSTKISPETGAGGFILPNDHVDVILTRSDVKASPTDEQQSETLLRNRRILAIDQQVQEKDGKKVVIGKTATLELTPQQAEKLAMAEHLGTLSLALRSIADARHDNASPSGPRNAKVTIFHGMKRQDYTVTVDPGSDPGKCTSGENECSDRSGADFPGEAPANITGSIPILRDQLQSSSGIAQEPFFMTSGTE